MSLFVGWLIESDNRGNMMQLARILRVWHSIDVKRAGECVEEKQPFVYLNFKSVAFVVFLPHNSGLFRINNFSQTHFYVDLFISNYI